MVTTLSRLAAGGADAERVAAASVAGWTAVHASLAPVVGARGSAALFKRTLHLAGRAHPWLEAVHHNALQPGDFSALRAALARQPSGDAAAAHDLMLQLFQDLLAELIGPSLTQRLLQTGRDSSSSGDAVRDTSS
jgi:hypothetical protein